MISVDLLCILLWDSMESEHFAKTSKVYIDKLGLSVFIKLLKYQELRNIYCLDGIEGWHRLLQHILRLRGVEVEDVKFYAGHLKTRDGESVYLAARRIAGCAALSASYRIVSANPMLEYLNRNYGRNTIRLFIAQQLARHIENWTSRALVAAAISDRKDPIVWLKKPSRFPEEILFEIISDVSFQFYSAQLECLLDFWKLVFTDAIRFFKQVFIGYLNRRALPKMDKPGVLMLQEENIRAQQTMRNQLYWLDNEGEQGDFEIYVLKSTNKLLEINTVIESKLKRKGVTLLPFNSLGSAWSLLRKEGELVKLRRDRKRAYAAALRASTSPARFFLARVGFLLWQSELMGAISKVLGVRVFVMKESIGHYATAMQLCAEKIGVRTIAIQYSNLGFIAPSMMTTADVFLSFSGMYKQIFSYRDLTPKKFFPIGYIYDGIKELVLEKATAHRSKLQAKGAKFIISYFDESVQSDRWGLMSKEDHLAELHYLALAVLEDQSLGVIVKTQFMKNSPSQLYPNNELILRAKATGRYLELQKGKHRNDVYPIEAAIASDFCIGHKFGATAALEAAVAGVRTIILDSYGSKTNWDKIYGTANIEFQNINEALQAFEQYRKGEASYQDLGDWEPILHYFVSRVDGTSIKTTRNIIKKWAIDPHNEIIF